DHGRRALCRSALTLYVLCPSLAHALPAHRTMVGHSIPIPTAVTSPHKAFLAHASARHYTHTACF
ncbi:hypothetical protein, partial [Acidiferrobacter sp.]|uniref:hypothetical protein n=1 Tax=Acidiferrobacter sp. TaxID=1872107 RepID=UPI002628756C